MKKRIIFLLLIMIPVLLLASCNKNEIEEGMLSAELRSNGKNIKITVMPEDDVLDKYKREDLYIFSFAPGEDPSDGFSGRDPIAKKRIDSKVTFKVPLTENGESRLYHSFAAAVYDDATREFVMAAESAAYITNPDKLSKNKTDFVKTRSIKGILAEYDTDAAALGASHIIIDVYVDDYILETGNSDALQYVFGKNTYFLDKSAVEKLDKRVSFHSGNGAAVYLRFLLKRSFEELPAGLSYLAYPDTKAGAERYSINMNDKKCAGAVAGFADFLAGRYCTEDSSFGTVSAFIAGYALNTPGKGAAGVTYDEYFGGAKLLLRTLYTAMASHYENGRVYVSIDHRWKASGVSELDSSGFKFLSELISDSESEGNFPWGVAVVTGSVSLDSDRIWYDDSDDGTYLTPSELGELTSDFLGDSDALYRGELRRVMVSGFAVSTTGSEKTEINQAASYAYAYYCAVATERIDAFVYSRQTDTETSSSGLRYVTDEGVPSAARKIYDVVKVIDTDEEIPSDIRRAISSDSGWKSLYSSYSEEVMKSLFRRGEGKSVKISGKEDPAERYKAEELFDFAMGDKYSFGTMGEGSYSGLTESGLKLSFKNESRADTGYIYKKGISNSEFKDDSVLVKLSDIGSNCYLKLVLVQDNGKKPDVIYESGEVAVAKGDIALIDFDISDFIDDIGKGDVEIRLYARDADGLPCELTVSSIMTGKEKTNTVLIVILIVLASAAVVTIAVLGVIWFRRNYEIRFDSSVKEPKEKKEKKGKKDKKNKKDKPE